MTGTHFISEEYKAKKSRDSKITYTSKDGIGTDTNYKHEIVWESAIVFLVFIILAGYGLIVLFSGTYKFYTLLWALFVNMLCTEAITIGAHRYYAHKAFKAKPLLRGILLVFQTMSGQYSVYNWCRDHRLHHRYSDTDADPHNARRGFFFSHIGWLMSRKHPLVRKLGKQIDMSDLEADWMVMFQKKYYIVLFLIIGVLIPVAVPVYFFGESWKNSIFLGFFLRYVILVNIIALVNSAGHLFGIRPYDANLLPVQSWFISFTTMGEGWHNYHHAFPWDYKAAELTQHFNFSATLIRFFEFLGLAWDLKTASPEVVERRIFRTGDGTHYQFGTDEARAAVTAVGFVHPFNPTYTTVRKNTEAKLKLEGLPLYHENDVLHIDNLEL